MAEDTGENGQPQEINSRADADQFAAAAKEAQDKSLNQIRESLKSQGWSDEVADRIANGLAQEEARVDEETGQPPPAAGGMRGEGGAEGGEPPEEPPEAPAAIPPEEPEEPGAQADFGAQVDELRQQLTNETLRSFLDIAKGLPPQQSYWVQAAGKLADTYEQERRRILDEISRLSARTPRPALEIDILNQELSRTQQEFERVRGTFFLEAGKHSPAGRGEAPEWITRLLQDKVQEGVPLTAEERSAVLAEIDRLDIATGPSPEDTVSIIVSDPDFAEKYLNKIVSRPEGDPLKAYKLGWYESINLEYFLHRIRAYDETRAMAGEISREESLRRFKNYSHESAMRESFHEMRRYMLEGNIRDFAQIARTIAPEYLQRASEYTGVGVAQRFYDTEFKKVLAKKQTIEPKDFEEIDKKVERRLRETSQEGILGRQLEEWEIRRALSVGGNYSVITLRIPELVSVGRIPSVSFTPEAVSKTFASFHYESVVRFLNPLRWLGSRFSVGAPHGGQWFLNEVYRAIDENNTSPSKLQKIFGLNRITLERSAPFLQASFDSGWRTIETYLNSFKVKTTVRDEIMTDPIDNEQYTIKVYDPNGREEEVEAGYYFNWQAWWAAQGERAKGFDINQAYDPLINQVHFYRGIMMKDTPVSAMDTKIELWRRMARDMPNQIMLILSGDEDFERLKDRYFTRNDGTIDEDAFEALVNKLTLYQERRLQQQRERIGGDNEREHVELDLDSTIGEFQINQSERQFINEVINLVLVGGKAEELVKIKWPSAPIFEDNLYERADYLRTGAEVFRRRIGGDALALYGAMEEVLPTISHPDMKFEAFMEHIEKAYSSLDTPFGFQMAQDLMYPFIRARFRFVGKYDWARTLPFVDDVLSVLGVPLSEAQKYYGREGEAVDGFGLRVQTEQLVGKGIVRRHKVGTEKESELTKLRGEVGASLWHIARERAPIGILLILLFLALQIGQRSLREK